jgi:hypothetical protein
MMHDMETQPTANRPTITATAHGDGLSPDTVELTIDGVTTIVDVGCDRDDWELPDVDDAIAYRVLIQVEDAVEAHQRDADDDARASAGVRGSWRGRGRAA